MVTFYWYDISLCENLRHCLIVEKINNGVCIIMFRKFLMNRLVNINNVMKDSVLSNKLVYASFVRKLNSDINFVDEFF